MAARERLSEHSTLFVKRAGNDVYENEHTPNKDLVCSDCSLLEIGGVLTNRCSCRLRLCLSIELWSIEAVVLADAAAQLNSMLDGLKAYRWLT